MAASPLNTARSWLFVPGSRPERIGKALAAGADAVIIDLENAVALPDKASARDAIRQAWPQIEPAMRARVLVRTNASSTPFHADDLALLAQLDGLGALMLPKTESTAQLAQVRQQLPAVPIVALVETAEGIAMADAIARSAGVLRLALAHIDLLADLGMPAASGGMELLPARWALLLASRRAGLPAPVDGVTTATADPALCLQDA